MSQKTSSLRSVIGASSVGTMIEWYDFYIFGSLATIISTKFFPAGNSVAAFLSTLAVFAAGFVVRPFGALFFGRLGDLIGRKYTFMITLLLMGGATFLIGCIPSFESIGYAAPILVLVLRLLQGLALGGEYGGAATYVAEHAPSHQRGLWTSWIQTTATLGLFISLLVIMLTKKIMGMPAFEDWGWRIPFWVSIIMVLVSFLIRKNMSESPLFAKAKLEGKIATNPLKESFGNKYNFKFVLLALLGATMGQGVIWYTGHYYAMSFLEKSCAVNGFQVNEIMVWAFALGTPLFVFFGWLSDKIGRKQIMLTGMLLAVLSYFTIYKSMYATATFSGKLPQNIRIDTSYTKNKNFDFSDTTVQKIVSYKDGSTFKETTIAKAQLTAAIKPATVVKKERTLMSNDYWWLVFLVWVQVLFVTMVYGPIAAFLVEMFPTKIRYTSMSLPYHIGNGVFGGLMPTVAVYLTDVAQKSNSESWYLAGIWYPVIIASVCFVIGLIFINGKDKRMDD